MGPEEIRREREANRQLAEKMETVGMLARGIAHDFNNILSGVLGFTSYLRSKADPTSDLYRDLGLIEESGNRASELARQLFLIARRRHGKRETVNMNAVLEQALVEIADELPSGITLDSHIPSDLPAVLAYQDQLRIVIRNLCMQSVRSMPEGGVLTVKAECRKLNERERQTLVNVSDASFVCIVIRDTGRGMSAEMRDHIFDPFYLSKTSRDGPGLDMSIVYGIISNNLGNVTVESEEGKGAAFRVYLPVYIEDAEGSAPDESALCGTETILVVDDELMVREMISWILDAKGYRVITAASGEDAVERYRADGKNIDLILLDIIMPGMGGEEAFQILRSIDPKVAVLLTSVHNQESLGERLTGQGALGIVFKPYKSITLLSAVRKALDSKKT